ncbi:MAG: hypothetical protein R3213_08665, partial [Flavobacteriaceae bacterium]|nr:hypothetical protein [Flavobacteriaceae bacterium]
MSIIEKTRNEIDNCELCHGRFLYVDPNTNEKVRCISCYQKNLFLRYYPKAKIIQEYVKTEHLKVIQDWLKKNDVVCVCSINGSLRREIKYSAAFLGVQCALYTKVYDDAHLIESA